MIFGDKLMKRTLQIGTTLAALMVWGCNAQNQNDTRSNSGPEGPTTAPTTQPAALALAADDAGKQAVATIHGAGDNRDKIHGKATFTQEGHGTKIVVDVDGLTPGKHGIHIHEKPDLSDAKLMKSGGHYNPDDADHKHAGPEDAKRHAGDLGNIEVDEQGHGHLELTDDDLSVDGPKNSVVGHSLIIHAKEDDLKSQPAGNAGDRIAGGVIVLKADHEKS